jgi:hypothetical protein
MRDIKTSAGMLNVTSKQLASMKVAQAANQLEQALGAFGVALREDAQLRISSAVGLAKQGLAEGEVRMEALIARVPGVGPWLAMEMFRATHRVSADVDEEEMPLRPSNFQERPANDAQQMLAYLECIGCHVA